MRGYIGRPSLPREEQRDVETRKAGLGVPTAVTATVAVRESNLTDRNARRASGCIMGDAFVAHSEPRGTISDSVQPIPDTKKEETPLHIA